MEKSEMLEDESKVDLSGNGSTTFPKHVLKNKKLMELNISKNTIHTIPADIRKLSSLTFLDVGQNPIMCRHPADFLGIPLELSYLNRLTTLKISQCNLRYIPPAIWRCQMLEFLNISKNKINVLPLEIGNLTNLRHLDAQHTSITTIPSEIAFCQSLEEILLLGNDIECLPEALRYLMKLRTMSVNYKSFCFVIDDYMEGLLKKGQIQSQHLPSVIFEMHSLESLDLSGMKINTLPDDCTSRFKELNLAQNFFQSLPSLVCSLHDLVVLDISSNKLKELPQEIESLKNLKQFIANDNEMEILPDSIGKLVSLEILSLSRNQITMMSAKIGKLKLLQTFRIDHNKLIVIPHSIVDLEELETLDLTGNLLTQLPECMSRMKKLTCAHTYRKLEKFGLWLHLNPLVIPPETVWKTVNVKQIFDYLKICYQEKFNELHRMKLIALGDLNLGKTSFVRTLSKGTYTEMHRKTDQLNLIELSCVMTPRNLKINVYNLSAHEYYRMLLPLFFDPSTLYMIVFDAENFTVDKYEKAIGCWLRILLLYCPKAVVKIVGINAAMNISAEIKRKVNNCLRNQLQNYKQKQKEEIKRLDNEITKADENENFRNKFRSQRIRLSKAIVEPLKIQNEISLVSNDMSWMTETEQFVSEIDSLVFETKLFPNVQQQIPEKGWLKLLQNIKTLSGCYLPCSELIQIAQTLEIGEENLKEGLLYLYSIGEILWYPEIQGLQDIIIHQPSAFAETLQSLFRCNMTKFLNFHKNHLLLSSFGFSSKEEMQEQSEMLYRGKISRQLLLCLLFPQEKNDDDISNIVGILQNLNLCCRVVSPEIGRNWNQFLHIPFFNQINYDKNSSENNEWPEATPEMHVELRVTYGFPLIRPEYLFQKMSCRLRTLVKDSTDWSNYIIAKTQHETVLIEKAAKDGSIGLKVRGLDVVNVNQTLETLCAHMEDLIKQCPGLVYQIL